MLVPKSGDLRLIFGSIRCQKIIGSPKMRKSMPRDFSCAAADSP